MPGLRLKGIIHEEQKREELQQRSQLKLNGNILICGGSGAGKIFYEVKPNLMQIPRNCSFICTDPKGENENAVNLHANRLNNL